MAIKFDRTKLTKKLADNQILVPFLDRAIEQFDEPWEFKYEEKVRDNGWHPSGDCTPTASQLYAQTQKPPESHSSSLKKSFMVGHFWHQWIQHIVVHKLGFAEPDDIERKGEYHWCKQGWDSIFPCREQLVPHEAHHYVTGSGDFAPLKAPRWSGICDIKTIGGDQFKVCQDTKKLPSRFAKKYICQINIYMMLFEQERAMILGVNKDSPHDFIEFTFERDQGLIDAIVDKWKFVSQCIDEGVTPTPEDDAIFALPIDK